MIRTDQISDALARIADEAYYDTAGDNPTMSDEDIMKHAIAAALNAWPGMDYQPGAMVTKTWRDPGKIILPLPKEASDE